MVRNALAASPSLSGLSIQVFGQGSSKNNTNVRTNSDLDLVALHECDPWCFPADGESLPPSAPHHAPSLLDQYSWLRTHVFKALEGAFSHSGIETANKCIKIKETATTRVPCDVLPAFRAWKYTPRREWPPGQQTGYQGVTFVTGAGEIVLSFPEQHLANGKAKNKKTGYRYKQVVRVLKKFKAGLDDDNPLTINGQLPSSYFIEAIAYNSPDLNLAKGDIYDAVVGVLEWADNALAIPSSVDVLKQVNGIQRLFPFWGRMGALLSGLNEPPKDVAVLRSFVKKVLAAIKAPN